MRVPSARPLLLFFLAFLLACGADDRPRVLILGLDGLDPEVVDLLIAEGKMPHFARLREQGAHGPLRSQKPLLSPILWTTIATGKGANEHGIGHFVAVDPESGERLPVTSRLRRVKALWNMAAESGLKPAVVGWWATWPAEEVGDGMIVSDHTAYHFLFEEGFENTESEGKTSPPELAARLEPLVRRPQDLSFEQLQRFVDVTPEEAARAFDFDDELGHFRWALATAISYRDIGLELWREDEPDLAMVYIEGTDSTSHLFGHLFRVEELAGDLAEQQKRYGRAVEAMYRFADEIVGDYLEAIDEQTTLLVISDHGFELGALHDDPSRAADLRRVSERFHRLDGIFYAYGRGVRPGARVEGAHILDIAPTVLALLELPTARDMTGKVLDQALADPVEPLQIVSWEDGSRDVEGGERDAATDRAMLEHLHSLGYLGGGTEQTETSPQTESSSQTETSPKGDRNLAAIAFQSGDYRRAAKAYKKLVDENPDDAGLLTSFAGVLGALERYDEALAMIEQALALEPLNAEAYHNRAVIHERRGETELAIDAYRQAVRYRPDYRPSRLALERLTGSTRLRQPQDEAEARADALAERASQAARRGDYAGALQLLEEAEQIAPRYVLIYQYRSNVAYLMGDREGAITALERGLEIEPDNLLFQANLERLKTTRP